MLEDALHAFTVSHSGTSHLLSLPSSTPLAELRNTLHSLTQVAAANQKLIVKGKALSASQNGEAISSLFPSGSKVLLIGSKQESIASLVAESNAVQKRYETLSSRTQTVKVRSTGINGKTVMNMNDLRSAPGSAFLQIEVLKSCPHEDLRKERLRKLSQDEAVLECMKARDWHVGLLTELHPHRDPTLLGLNKNAGEAVYLRLLTDDLSGLRPYFHTRMVLLHELTHNKHGDHDEAFKTLNSLLNKEVKVFEAAKRAGAHRLGGEVYDAYEPEEVVEEMCGSSGKAAGMGQSASTSSATRTARKPAQVEDGPWEQEQRRRAMLEAAEARRKQQ